MRMFIPACFAFFAVACGPASAPPSAATEASAGISIVDAWAAPTPSGVDIAAGYLSITNGTAADDVLVGVSTPRATRSDIHEMSGENGVMRMRAVPRLTIPAGQTVTLGPGGLHLMFTGLDHPFTAGENIPLRLSFEHAGVRDITLSVRARNETHPGH